ncbi:MAG: hypothetical protein JWO69_2021 [Thermoleophilia bacterium]|nr:hypothetical protein [Thermoleophilia bacterium]
MPRGEHMACTRPDHHDRRRSSGGWTRCYDCRREHDRKRDPWRRPHRLYLLLLQQRGVS